METIQQSVEEEEEYLDCLLAISAPHECQSEGNTMCCSHGWRARVRAGL
jgi:hypothetical protein